IKTKERYVWTKREATEAGSPLGELVDQGISRVKSSSDVVGAVMKELRLQSSQPGADFRMAVAVDGVNALWGRSTIKRQDKTAVEPEELTLVYNLRKLMKNDWVRGIQESIPQNAVFHKPSVDINCLVSERRGHHYHSVSDWLPLHPKICLLTSRAARRGLRLTILPYQKYQRIKGFGGAMTDAAAINILSLSAGAQEQLLRQYFSKDGISYSVVRVPMASCDFSTRLYTYADTPGDYDLKNFTLAQEDMNMKVSVLSDVHAARYIHGVAVHFYMDGLVPAETSLGATHQLYPEYYLFGTEACAGWSPLDRGVKLGSWDRAEKYAHDIIEVKRFPLLHTLYRTRLQSKLELVFCVILHRGKLDSLHSIQLELIQVSDVITRLFYMLTLNLTCFLLSCCTILCTIFMYSKFLWEGSQRVGVSTSGKTQLEFSAFVRPDGSVVLIVLNRY
ncbi:hypothetical protein GOODEAATRI_002260, partial [Goodea atripinnis]